MKTKPSSKVDSDDDDGRWRGACGGSAARHRGHNYFHKYFRFTPLVVYFRTMRPAKEKV